MPQIGNLNTMPEFINGRLLAGNLSTDLNGFATLKIKGRWSIGSSSNRNDSKNLVIVCSITDENGVYSVSYAYPTWSESTNLTTITFKTFDTATQSATPTTAFSYMIWINESDDLPSLPKTTETINL